MKIVFICGCLEPGKDGVGDYTRKLAAELKRKGIKTSIAALFDKEIKNVDKNFQYDESTRIDVLRIPQIMKDSQRYKILTEYLKTSDPNWLSLQFVPYSFNVKGLPFKIGSNLKKLGNKFKWHIMFHQIWLDNPDSLKAKLIGRTQKYLIKRLHENLKPNFVNVSTNYVHNKLIRESIPSEVLPLFGNISFSKNEGKFKLEERGEKKILYFGSPPRDDFAEQIIIGFKKYLINHHQMINFIVISRPGILKNNFLQRIKNDDNLERLNVISFDFLPEKDISTIMQICDVGIVRSTEEFLGKSGTAISMLEHGLPIWMPKIDTIKLIDLNFRNHLIYSDLNNALQDTSQNILFSRLNEISDMFIRHLKITDDAL